MVKSQRLRLTAQFVATTFCIYIGLFGLGLIIFKSALTSSLDSQIETLLSQVSDEVEYDGQRLSMTKPRRLTRKQPMGVLAAVELFDRDGRIIQSYGTQGSRELVDTLDDFKLGSLSMRSRSLSLSSEEGEHVGYLQIQLPTTLRDRAVSNYATTMGVTAFLGFIALSIAGYVFARRTTRPIEASYQMLRQFTADAAHELNTPVATIAAAVENLKEELEPESEAGSRLLVIERAGARMDKLVQDLMLLIRLGAEAERRLREPETFDLKILVEESLADFADLYARQSLDLVAENLDSVKITGFRDNLGRLLSNLLDNALKYTGSGGKVRVGLKSEGNGARLLISDTGAGIPAESLPEIFNRFYRVDRARSSMEGGSGLGLAIVKAIVDLHGGQIEVESSPGKGTTFSIYFPCNRV